MAKYVVRKGDSFDSIARKHGLHDWKALYNARENASLRVKRRNPHLIQPGDVVHIPSTGGDDPTQAETIKKLKKLQEEMRKSMRSELRYLANEKRKLNRLSTNVDTAATMALIAVDLGKLVNLGYKASIKTGKELAAINARAAPGAKDFLLKHAGNAGGGLTLTGDESLALGIGKTLLISYSQMTSPSYWSNRWVKWRTGKTPLQTIQEAEHDVKRQHEAMIRKLQKRIDELKAAV